jgi:hypothetical protein
MGFDQNEFGEINGGQYEPHKLRCAESRSWRMVMGIDIAGGVNKAQRTFTVVAEKN